MEKRSLREAVNEVRGMFKLMNADTYTNISDRQISAQLQNYALAYIKQATDKRKLWNSPNIFTTLKCLKMIKVPLSECCAYTHPCMISRSIVQLPKIAEGTHFGMLIQGVYSVDFPNPNATSRRFIESTPDRFANSLGMKLTTKQIHFWIQDRYLYISDPEIEQVKISAYFEEDIPLALQSYPDFCKETRAKGCCPASTPTDDSDIRSKNKKTACCPPNPYDEEFKCPGYMYKDVLIAVRDYFDPYKKSQDDKTSDKMDTTK